MRSRYSRLLRAAVCAFLGSLLAVWAVAAGTLGGFSAATVGNPTNNAGTGLLAISHAYPTSATCSATPTAPVTTTSCSSSLYPPSVPASGTALRSDAIANTGTYSGSAISARARVASCGPVQLANSVAGGTNGAMLPRNGTTFSPTSGPMTSSGAITLNGSTGYASSVASTSEPTGPVVIGQSVYGLGIWFKTSSTSVSPLFGFGSNSLDTTGSNDRILYLDAAGKIGFIATTSGASTVTGTAAGVPAYNDGAWHFAYVVITANKLLAGLNFTITIFVDGAQASSTGSGLLGSLASYSGYWHAGWSPIGGTPRYFTGSLSDFIVDDSGNAPATIAANPTTYTSFDANRTEQWPMNDSGGAFDGTTTAGTLPAGTTLPTGPSDPCTSIDIAWAMTNPAATVLANMTIRAAVVTAGWTIISARPGPGVTQTSPITTQRDATFNAYVAGLIIYAPIQMEYSVGTAPWTVSFVWGTPAAGAATGSTFVIA
jgi:hypothetical protein